MRGVEAIGYASIVAGKICESSGDSVSAQVENKIRFEKRLFNVDEYYRMFEASILSERDRLELIEGEIVEMSPIGSRHAAIVNKLNALIGQRIEKSAIISVQNPVRFSEILEPEPDLALLKPQEDFYSGAHPTPNDVLLLIEVADTSLDYDRAIKLPLYARAGILETWIVDLSKDTVELHARPITGEYRETLRYKRGEKIESKTIPNLQFAIKDILK